MRRGVRAVVAWLGLAAATMASPPAAGCENGVEIAVDPRVAQLQEADRKLASGEAVAAAQRARRIFPNLRTASLSPAGKGGPTYNQRLLARALRIVAVAEGRAEGGLSLGPEWPTDTPQARDQNYEWSVSVLRRLQMRQLNDPVLLTDLGEVLSHREKYQDEAKRMLEFLAEHDVVTSPQGWAALARLRGATGDPSGERDATARCEQMAGTANLCGRVPAEGTGST